MVVAVLLMVFLRGHWMGTKAIAFSPDGKWLASVSRNRENNQIYLWLMPPYNYLTRTLVLGIAIIYLYWKRAFFIRWINQ